MRVKCEKKTALAYITMLFSFMSAYPVFYGTTGSAGWYLFYYGKYVLTLGFVAFTFLYRFRETDLTAMLLRKKLMLLFLLCPIVIVVYSAGIWAITKPTFNFISRGISTTLFSGIAYAGGVAIACSLKEDAPKCGIAAVLTTYTASVVLGLARGGMDFLQHSLFFRTKSIQGVYTELHEAAFVIGMYILFLLFINRKEYFSNSRLALCLCVLFFVIGWKRIGFAALLLTMVYILVVQKRNKPITTQLRVATGIVTIAVCFLYVSFSVSEGFIAFLQSHGISMMGRNIIFRYFRQFCEFDVRFLGRGVGFVTRQFEYTTKADLQNMVSIRALHNDFMKMFIEIGFIGFLVWCWFWLIYIPNKIEKYAGIEAGFWTVCLMLYAFVTYTTDNTAGYFSFQMHLAILIFTICYHSKVKGKEQKKTNGQG